MIDQEMQNLIAAEHERQMSELCIIASENYASKAVLDAAGSSLMNKYSEGYPGKRYYAGNRIVDQIENLAISRAQELFKTDYHVNVQPHSGSSANMAAYVALLEPGDTILAMSLAHGGHLTHGHPVSLTGKLYNFVHYGVSKDTELIDYDEILRLAREHKPKLIVAGTTAYGFLIDFAKFARIAREVGAWYMVDMAHISGLIAGGVHPTPFGHADVITSTTHKTLRGPRSGLIFCKKEFAKNIDRAVFPGMQGGPLDNIVAAKAVAFQEAIQPSFAIYTKQIVDNAKAMAYRLMQHGFRLAGDGTETHLLLLDLSSTKLTGKPAQELLEQHGIICNMNSLPFDERPPMDPSGLRIGTAALTTRGLKERDVETVADAIASILTTGSYVPEAAATVSQLAKKFRIPGY